jgi:hypothetical protein
MHNPEWTSHGAPSGRSHGVDFLIPSSVTPRFFVPCELPLYWCISNGTQPERFFLRWCRVSSNYSLQTPWAGCCKSLSPAIDPSALSTVIVTASRCPSLHSTAETCWRLLRVSFSRCHRVSRRSERRRLLVEKLAPGGAIISRTYKYYGSRNNWI